MLFIVYLLLISRIKPFVFTLFKIKLNEFSLLMCSFRNVSSFECYSAIRLATVFLQNSIEFYKGMMKSAEISSKLDQPLHDTIIADNLNDCPMVAETRKYPRRSCYIC